MFRENLPSGERFRQQLMSEDMKSATLKAFRLVLRPLVRILLRSGVTWKEAADICKATFVEIATKDFGLHGRPTNISRTAILTGLSRREVSRLRNTLDHEEAVGLGHINSATGVLSGWHLDRDFLDGSGTPKVLPFDGEGHTFTSLCRKYAGDFAPITMCRELTRVGGIKTEENGNLRALMRYYLLAPMNPDALVRSGSALQDLGNNLNYNLTRKAHGASRFEGRATNANIKASDIETFNTFLETESMIFLERVDSWLTVHEPPKNSRRNSKVVRLGVGVYQIQDNVAQRKEHSKN